MNILFIGPTQREMGTILLYLKAGWNVTIKQFEELKIDDIKNFCVVVDGGTATPNGDYNTMKYKAKIMPVEDTEEYQKKGMISSNTRDGIKRWAQAMLITRPNSYVVVTQWVEEQVDLILPETDPVKLEEIRKRLNSMQ